MSIKDNNKNINTEKNGSSNLINIIEKYFLPNDTTNTQAIKANNMDTNLSDYLSLVSTTKENKITIKSESQNSTIITPDEKKPNFSKIFRNYIFPYFTLKDLIYLKKSNKMFNFLVDKKSINLCVLSNTTKKLKSIKLREEIWYHYLNIKQFNKELFEKESKKFNKDINDESDNDYENKEKIFYNRSVEIINKIKNNEKEKLPEIYNEKKIQSIEKSLDIISRDIDRTFKHSFFTKENRKEGLRRILYALAQ